jgi:hypothetical protein
MTELMPGFDSPRAVFCAIAWVSTLLAAFMFVISFFVDFDGGGEDSGASMGLTVNALNMEYTSDFESPVSIEIPAEALTAEVEDISPAALGSAAGAAEESVAS